MKKLVKLLGSPRLAVILLVLLVLGLSLGTIVEARASAEAAGRLVYHAGWFLALQGLLGILVALAFPWGKKRIALALIHAALLLILAGAALTFCFKVEGSLGLWEGDSASLIERHDAQGRVLSRHKLPFSVRLDAFVLDTYPGTQRPAGFMSLVQITDRDTGRTFPARIWMNHELHYRGYALFQSGFEQEGGRRASVLLVSRDPGQHLVFAGFIALLLGMLAACFRRFPRIPRGRIRNLTVGALLLMCATVGKAQGADLRRLPVQHDGRVMAFDTLARETVWTLTGGRTWKGQGSAATMTEWLVDPEACANAPIVEVGSREFAQALGLPPGTTHGSFVELVRNPRVLRLIQAAQESEGPRRGLLREAEGLDKRLMLLDALLRGEAVRPLPVPGDPKATWGVPETGESLAQLASGPRLEGWPSPTDIDREVFYNQLNPVRLSWILLLGSLLLSLAAWVRGQRLLDTLAFGALIAGSGMMTWGLLLRGMVGGRIPAANMYESLLFLGWGIGLFGLLAHLVLKNRLILLNAAFMATLTMALVDFLPLDRFIHPIAPVLAGTPWLAIHVPIIMLGYAILTLGLVAAHMQIGLDIFAPRRLELAQRIAELNDGYIFTGSIFLLAGIITGSMWAASSWGRYWGWDPKEVWSLVAFLAYMAILHARRGALIGSFGVAVLSIAAFQTLLMTYLGVNFVLSTGLHSYGMGDSPVLMGMGVVAGLEASFLLWGLLAHRKKVRVIAP